MLLRTIALALLLVASPLGTEAQQTGQVHRIGYISIGGPPTPAFTAFIRPMIEQLRADGWTEGRNLTLEYRFDEGKRERLPALVAELINLKVSAIVAVSTPAALAARKATATIPIVMVNVGDPVRNGLVASLARPGGNVTGMAFLGPEIILKQLELLKEAVPHARTLGILFDPINPAQVAGLADTVPAAARALGLQLHPIEVAATTPLEAAFAEVIRKRVDMLLIYPLSRRSGWDQEIAELALRQRVPTLGTFSIFAERGMLLAFAPSAEEQVQRAATYIDRILRGTKPSDLPVEQPTRFHLVVNRKTAKALGLTLPNTVLLRADQVIE
jgi:putative ABC transport system substrate-binding protein